MTSPNKEKAKLEPRTTHVPEVGHEKNPKGYKNVSQDIGPINPTEGNQGLNEFHGPERMGNDMDWKIGPKRTIWIGRLDQFREYGPSMDQYEMRKCSMGL